MSLNSRGNLSWNDDVATGWSRSNLYDIFSVNRYAYCVWLLHKYEAHMKGLPIFFSEVQVKNDVTDNNNKHFVTAFEGKCRNIIELREHLKLCFLIILVSTVLGNKSIHCYETGFGLVGLCSWTHSAISRNYALLSNVMHSASNE